MLINGYYVIFDEKKQKSLILMTGLAELKQNLKDITVKPYGKRLQVSSGICIKTF